MAITRYSPGRILVVTLALAVAGAIFGAVAGAVALGVSLILSQEFHRFEPLLFAVAATVGGYVRERARRQLRPER